MRLPETPGDAVPAIWKRLLVAGGGVAANVLLACVCFSVAMSHGTERWAAVVGDVDAGAPAWQKGIPSGAVIEQIDDVRHPLFEDIVARVATTTDNEHLRVVYTAAGADKPVSVDLVPRLDANQLQPRIGVVPAFIPRLVSKRGAAQQVKPVVAHSAADRAEPPFAFDDVIVGTTDPDDLDQVWPLPRDPRNPESGRGDYFDWLRRLRRLAGKDITVQVRRADGNLQNIRLPAAYHVTLPMRMHMGPIAAVREGSAGAKAGVKPSSPSEPIMDGDRILAVGVPEPDGATTVYREEKLDPLRLPYQLREWSWRMAKAGMGDQRTVTLTVERLQPGNAVVEVTMQLTWDPAWEDQHDITATNDSPLSIPELGIAYYVTSQVAGIDAVAAGQPEALQPGDVIVTVQPAGTGRPVTVQMHEWAGVFARLQAGLAQDVAVEVVRNGQRQTLRLTLAKDTTWPREDRGLILAPDTRLVQAGSLADALVQGWREVGSTVALTVRRIANMVSGRVGADNLGGPVAVSRTGYQTAGYDPFGFIRFLGYISMAFSFNNLWPIPLLDGGDVLLLAIEKLKGQPLTRSTRRLAYLLAGSLLLLCTCWIVVADLLR